MAALPLSAPLAGDSEDRFESRFQRLCRRYEGLWRQTGDAPPTVGPPQPRRRQWANARATRRLIDHLAAAAESCPEHEPQRRAWREQLKEDVRRFGEERLGWPGGYRDLLFDDAFFDSTVCFSREARAFDPAIRGEDVMQALRNVWIMNSLQMLLDLEVRFTPAVFAYSMLYPCTDNLLDDPELPAAAKRRLNRRLSRRLRGEPLPALDGKERRIWDLVGRIEGEFPRAAFPEVWRSLLAIHGGQVESLRQQQAGLGADELLRISIAKGGASVLADGYLAAGNLDAREADFCFGYGVFLQLLDDLQDARADREAGHATLFSTAEPPLDRLAARLYRFMHRVVDGSRRFAGPAYAARRDLILRNCRTLLVGAVAEDSGLFSRPFRRRLEGRWPLRFRAMRRLRRTAQRQFQRTAQRLRERRGVESLFELLE